MNNPLFQSADFSAFGKSEVGNGLRISPLFSSYLPSPELQHHMRAVEGLLDRIVPKEVLKEGSGAFLKWASRSLPLLKWSSRCTPPDCFTICLFCQPVRVERAENFFLELIRRWLLPEKELRLLSFHHFPFHLQDDEQTIFLLAEIKIIVENGQDLHTIQNNLPLLEQEIVNGINAPQYAQYILETKALSYSQKMTLVHRDVIKVLQKKPKEFDASIFREMGRFLALSPEEFKEIRQPRHISRLIFSHTLIRKSLRRAVIAFPKKRHLYIRLLPTQLNFPFGNKRVLGLMIGVCLFDKQEFFEEHHILLAAQKLIPHVQYVKASSYIYQKPQDNIRSLYLELEKKDGSRFTLEELRLLKQFLGEELKGRIEKLIPSVFMTRNEEEIMKNMLTLSQELKYTHDLPQVMISFEEQTSTDLIFTIILVRILKKEDPPLEKYLGLIKSPVKFLIDRVQTVGHLRKKYPKEANIFRLQIPKEQVFLRADSSVNLYSARQKIVHLLHETIGEIRDYNGGMILKQSELFAQFKESFSDVSKKNRDLLEDFFYSVTPIEMQATIPLSSLSILFKMFLEGLQEELPKKESYFLKSHEEGNLLYVMVRAADPSFQEHIDRCLGKTEIGYKSLAVTTVHFQESLSLGYIYTAPDSKQRLRFLNTLIQGIDSCVTKLRKLQILRLSFLHLPLSLDPRLGGDEISGTVIKMLYDGLTRIGRKGKPVCSIAQKVTISPNLKEYTFILRKCYWSNGDPISAHDFDHAWKKILSPEFNAPFDYFFYPIKNAQLVKEGVLPIDQLGLHVIDDFTLKIELEYPTPYFLELIAHPLYSPVNHRIDKIHPDWVSQEGDAYVCNGPFRLKKCTSQYDYELVKNEHYWDAKSVHLDQIIISRSNAQTAFEMFKNDEIDWIGRPMRPWEPFFSSAGEEQSDSFLLAGTYWYVFNVERFPFHNTKLRQALAFAINRKELLETLKYQGLLPAISPLPLAHSQYSSFENSLSLADPQTAISEAQGSFIENYPENLARARALFQEALEELKLSKDKFPVITLFYSQGDLREKTAKAIKQQWHNALGISCRIEAYEWPSLVTKLHQREYQVMAVSWRAWFDAPIYTLNTFKSRNNKLNLAGWKNLEYQHLLDLAIQTTDPIKRKEYFAKAENVLIRERPVIPLFYEVQQYLKKNHLHKVYYTATGNIDFKWAYLDKNQSKK